MENGQSKGKGCATAPTRERRHEGIKIAPFQASSIETFTQQRRRHKIEISAIGLLSQASEGQRNSTLQSGAIPVIQLLSMCQSNRKWPGCKGPSTALAGVCRSVACRHATKSATPQPEFASCTTNQRPCDLSRYRQAEQLLSHTCAPFQFQTT